MLRLIAAFTQTRVYMAHEWIIDVLSDLRTFAERNGLDATAAQLQDACLVALAETAGAGGVVPESTQAHEGKARNVTHLFAKGDIA